MKTLHFYPKSQSLSNSPCPLTAYLIFRLNCDNIMHYHWDFDASNSQTWRVSALDNHQIEARVHNFRVFPGGEVPPIWRKFCQSSPIRHLSPFLDQGLPPPAEVRPRKCEKLKYIFVSNLTTCTLKLISTLKSCIPCLKKKLPNFALGGQFWLQSDFFRKSPPLIRLRPRQGPTGNKNFESPSSKI